MGNERKIAGVWLKGDQSMENLVLCMAEKNGISENDEAAMKELNKSVTKEINEKYWSVISKSLDDFPLVSVQYEDGTEWLYVPILNMTEFVKEHGIM